MATDRIVTLRGEKELVRRAGHLFGSARSEFLCAAEDLVTWSAGVNAAFAEGFRPMHGEGLSMHKLYTPRAVADGYSEQRLLRVSEHAQVRISSAPLPREAIVIDRKVAILAGPPAPGTRTYSVVSSPDVVDGVRSLFGAAWESATELHDFLRARAAAPPVLSEEARRILRMLGDGHTDETAARLLRMSLRTYRRRVADVMTLLGATSRFQAGLRARELDGPL
ncbi:DNA-binding response regulator [Streptomyces sp. ISL-10]|uniref:DNA-binding response regulator n=1 Tax=Streptomyces sp. ISL-10 TaxID=2819172 RepID=UPI001BED2DBA|nr:DNA-binding response regulator [Streptomyces sp. ISL-10]MBT2368727.1 DNA-binding response regulator [Streptomyces sp. ISL-10]